MTYDPRTYWPDRYRAQGDTYVARGGDPDSYVEQLENVGSVLTLVLPTSGRVLDFGCGPGRFRPLLEDHGLEYDGYDLIPGLGTVDRIEPERYDCAVAIYVLQHIVDEAEYVAAMTSIWHGLRPGGQLFVVDAMPMANPAPHMKPRGRDRVADFLTGPNIVVEPDADPIDPGHWVGLFTK